MNPVLPPGAAAPTPRTAPAPNVVPVTAPATELVPFAIPVPGVASAPLAPVMRVPAAAPAAADARSLKRERESSSPGASEASSEPALKRLRTEAVPATVTDAQQALTEAIVAGDLWAIRRLLDRWPQLCSELLPGELRQTPLHLAAEKGQVAIARELLARGAVVDAVSSKGFTALAEAAAFGDVELIDLLFQAEASLHTTEAMQRIRCIFPLAIAIEKKKLDACQRLIAYGVMFNEAFNATFENDPHAGEIFNQTHLNLTVDSGFTELVQWLLATKRWAPDLPEASTKAQLIYLAIGRGNLPLIHLLINHGARCDLPVTLNGQPFNNVWEFADATGKVNVIEGLLKRGLLPPELSRSRDWKIVTVDMMNHQDLLMGTEGAAPDGLTDATVRNQPYKILEAGAALGCFSNHEKYIQFAKQYQRQGWSISLFNMRREAFESIEKLIGKNAFKLAVAEHVITASSAQRLQFLATVVLANKSQPNFLQVGLTPEGAMMMSQMVELQRKLMRKAVVHIFSQFRSYVASLPDIAVNRFISLSGIVNERDLYRVLTKEWGMYDPLARAAIRLVKASYEKLRNTPESAMPPSFAALPPAARLKEVIASVLSNWDKIDEMVATLREANGIDQLDILVDLLFLQWRLVCEAFGVKKSVWRPPQPLQAVPASAAPADTTTVAQPADIGV